MIQVEIKNFQAIDDLKLTVEGFTALVGRSNIGKSSIVRALKCALSGSSGTDFVRHDAKLCSRLLSGTKSCKCFAAVKLTFGEGEALLWEKGARGINRYTVWKGGVEAIYDRVGQGMDLPEFLEGQFSPVKLGPSDALLQVSSQFDPPFLLDLSGPAVASVLSDIGQLDDINQALTAVAKDRRSATARRKVREEDAAGLQLRLKAYEGVDAHVERVERAQQMAGGVESLQQKVSTAARLILEVSEAAGVLRRVAVVAEKKPPDPGRLRVLDRRLGTAAGFLSGWDVRVVAVQALLRGLKSVVPDAEPWQLAWRRRTKAADFERALREREAVVRGLDQVSATRVPEGLPALQERALVLGRLDPWSARVSSLEASHARAAQLEGNRVPDGEWLNGATRRLAEATRLLERQQRLVREAMQTKQELEAAEAVVQSVLQQFSALGLCPTCQQHIAPEHAHAS